MKKVNIALLSYVVLLLAMTPFPTLAIHTLWDGGTIIFNVRVSNAVLLAGGVVFVGFVVGFLLNLLVSRLRKLISSFSLIKMRASDKKF